MTDDLYQQAVNVGGGAPPGLVLLTSQALQRPPPEPTQKTQELQRFDGSHSAFSTANEPANANGDRRYKRQPHRLRRSPLGYHLRLLALPSRDPRDVLAEAAGSEFADRVVRGVQFATLEELTRTRAEAGEPAPTLRQVHGHAAKHMRRIVRLVLLVLEEMGTESGKACGSRLWLGKTRDERTGKYVKAGEQLGLAQRVGVCVRELQRYIALLQHADVWRVWQPMERTEGGTGCRAPAKLPRHMRGEVYAYNVYQLRGPMPRRLKENLLRFYGKKKSPPNGDAATAASSGPAGAAANADGDSFALDVLAELKAGTLAARTRERPS